MVQSSQSHQRDSPAISESSSFCTIYILTIEAVHTRREQYNWGFAHLNRHMHSMCHNKVSTQRPYARIRVRASDKCTNGRPRQTGTGVRQILKRVSERIRSVLNGGAYLRTTPANDVHLSRTNRHTKVYNRVFRRRSPTERRWTSVWHWELPKKKQGGLLHKQIVYSVGIPNDSHLLVLIRPFPKQASKNYTNGHSTSTGMGVWQVRAQARARARERERAYRMNGNGRSYGHSAVTILWHVPYIEPSKTN